MCSHLDLESFTIRPYHSKRLHEYCARMGKDDLHVVMDDNVRDALLAQGFTTEEAPRSVYKVEKLYEALSSYAPKHAPSIKPSSEFEAGVSLAYSCFAKPHESERLSILPFTPETITLITSNPTGSPGLTNYGCTKVESQVRALERGIQTLQGVKAPEPCLAFKRTQFNDKTRLVWGYPYSMTVVEGLVAYPLLQVFKRGYTPMAFAMSSGALGTKLRVASYHKEWAYSLDMSQFDATIAAKLIHIAFKVLRTWFDMDQVEPVTGCSVREVFALVERYFIHTPIVMPDSQLYLGKKHGVPSGSYFTQMIDSIVNVIIGGAISARFNLHVDKREIFVLGDDLLMWSNRKVDLDVISQYANVNFGVKLHGSEKSVVYHFDEVVHFLGRDWDNGIPTLDTDEVLKRMIYPEKFRKYSDDYKERQREVKMLLLAYAATYRSAWRIASIVIDPSDRNRDLGCSNIDVNVYDRGRPAEVNPEHLSGLQRFIRKYHSEERKQGDYPNTALQFWN